MHVVFDTNVLVSALLIENSTPARAFLAALDHGEILLSEALGFEIQRILRKRKFSRYSTADSVMNSWSRWCRRRRLSKSIKKSLFAVTLRIT
jgi:predicted nucleic acid-binding protein